ncbi:MAG: CDGSH iron-sulfur domain-containing protein [Polynucleobacter sp.]
MKPAIAQKAPYPVEVQEGQVYYWCACGKSKKQPFCDGSHKASGFNPIRFLAGETTTVYFCGCKQTLNPPFCDGSHSSL